MQQTQIKEGETISLGKFWLIASYDDVSGDTDIKFSGRPDKKSTDQFMSFLTVLTNTLKDATYTANLIEQAIPGLKEGKAKEFAERIHNFDPKKRTIDLPKDSK